MATLYVENIPEELYEALRSQARARRRSITAEVLALLEANIATATELRARHDFVRKVRQLRSKLEATQHGSPSAEETLREDRGR